MNNETTPDIVRLNTALGQVVERAGFENAAVALGLDIARDPEWYRLDGVSEASRPYYNTRTSVAWRVWQYRQTQIEGLVTQIHELQEQIKRLQG